MLEFLYVNYLLANTGAPQGSRKVCSDSKQSEVFAYIWPLDRLFLFTPNSQCTNCTDFSWKQLMHWPCMWKCACVLSLWLISELTSNLIIPDYITQVSLLSNYLSHKAKGYTQFFPFKLNNFQHSQWCRFTQLWAKLLLMASSIDFVCYQANPIIHLCVLSEHTVNLNNSVTKSCWMLPVWPEVKMHLYENR